MSYCLIGYFADSNNIATIDVIVSTTTMITSITFATATSVSSNHDDNDPHKVMS